MGYASNILNPLTGVDEMKIRSKLPTLLEPKSIIFGATLFNWVLIYMQVKRMEGVFCVVCPWYVDWDIAIYPHLLLVAAFGLWFSKLWSYILGMLLSAHTFYLGGAFLAHLIVEPNDSWMVLHSVRDFLLLQFALGAIIFCYATFCLVQAVYRRQTIARQGV